MGVAVGLGFGDGVGVGEGVTEGVTLGFTVGLGGPIGLIIGLNAIIARTTTAMSARIKAMRAAWWRRRYSRCSVIGYELPPRANSVGVLVHETLLVFLNDGLVVLAHFVEGKHHILDGRGISP